SAFIAAAAVGRGGLPKGAGRPPVDGMGRGGELMVYAGVLLAVPLLGFLVSRNTLAGDCLTAFGVLALGTILVAALRSEKVERERLFVVLILMFFSMLFWAFFEQAGSSVNNFTDRNVDRIVSQTAFTQEQVGKTIEIQANQALVGLKRPDGSI